MCPPTTDVAIVGGGVAGAAAALTLHRYSALRCVVLEASDYGLPRPGETVSAGLAPLLAYLGFDWDATAPDRAVCVGSEAAWGESRLSRRAGVFSGEGPGWNLDRRRFDRALADAAEAAGAAVLRGARFRSASRDREGRWRLSFDRQGATHHLLARHVIDASGRRAAFAAKAGAGRAVHDGLVGLTAYVGPSPGAPVPQTTLVESAPDGWWYATPLPGGRAVLAFMTDADLVRSGEAIQAAFERRLALTAHVSERYAGFPPAAPLRVNPAQVQALDRCSGPGWIAAGDAAASYDPLSSLGIGHALTSGIHAARATHARFGGDESLADSYAANVARNHADHLARSAAHYAAEGRWPDEAFWRRRRPRAP